MKTAVVRVFASLVIAALLNACGGGSDSTLAGGGGGGGGTPGTLALGAASYAVSQPTTTIALAVTRTGGSSGAVTIQYSTANGTAASGTDYTATSGTLSWADGDAASKTINVPVGATPFTGTRTFTVTLATPTGSATLGSPAAATVTITGNGAVATPGTLALSAASYTVLQSAGTATISVTRTAGTTGAVTIHYATANGTGTAGSDYTAASGTLSWADGDAANKTFSVALGATAFTGSRTFTVTLSAPTGSATLGTPGTATVSITGSGAAAGTLALGAATYAVTQPTATVTIGVTRTGGSSGAVTLQYATANGTALAGTDYTAASGTLSWADSDIAAKSVNVAIGTTAFTGTKTFTFAISAPTGSATLGTPATATVTITGSGAAGTLAMASANVTVLQSAATVALTVSRTGGSSGAVSVQYATANGTATAGTDYTTANGTLNWASGDAAAKTINVPISTTAFTGSRAFTVALSAVAGGATLGTPATTTVSITGTGGGGTGTTTHVPFTLLPSWAGGPGTEWVNGETRLVKDNNPAGSGEIFGFVWPDGTQSMNLLASADSGATWRIVSGTPTNSCGSPCPYHVIALTQDSTGKVHAIGWATIADSGYYLRFTLAYTGGHISSYSVDTPGGIALPNHNRKGTELRADIKTITTSSGAETVAYAVNMPTLNCTPVCDIKVYMARATSLAPTSSAQLVNLAGGAGDTLVFDSCTVSACSTFGFSTHVHTALFAQNATSHDLYLFQGPIDGDYGLAYGDSTFNTIYMRRLPSSAGAWTIGTLSTISSTVQANVSPELMSVASGTGYAWLMYVDPAKGVTFGRVDTAGSYSEGTVPSPDTTVNRNGWGALSVSADDTKVWAIWDTLAPISGGSARAGEGYWDGATWTRFTDAGASDSMGMAGIAGWKTGTAAILFNGNVLAQTYRQPTAASIQTQ